MAVSRSDRERMRRLAELFQEAETDEEPDSEGRRARIEAANRWRLAHGIAELQDDDADEPPELELYRRARALGLSGHRG
jgi:hypothetical protein